MSIIMAADTNSFLHHKTLNPIEVFESLLHFAFLCLIPELEVIYAVKAKKIIRNTLIEHK